MYGAVGCWMGCEDLLPARPARRRILTGVYLDRRLETERSFGARFGNKQEIWKSLKVFRTSPWIITPVDYFSNTNINSNTYWDRLERMKLLNVFVASSLVAPMASALDMMITETMTCEEDLPVKMNITWLCSETSQCTFGSEGYVEGSCESLYGRRSCEMMIMWPHFLFCSQTVVFQFYGNFAVIY